MMLCLILVALAVAACGPRSPITDSAAGVAVTDPPLPPDLRDAADALAAGRPWRATELLTPILRDPSRRTPEALLLAARAAAAWHGWSEVERLLQGERWLDSAFDGRARALLARALLEQHDDSSALRQARLALAAAPADDPDVLGARLVLLARAYERGELADSARRAWERAARELPAVSDWLRLRAAALSPDSAARGADYAAMTALAAVRRVPATEAAALLRAGDTLRAAEAYDALGERATALRLRAAVADSAGRAAIRRDLVRLVERRRGTGEARRAAAVLDDLFAPLTASEELAVARSAADAGPAARAARGFARAFAARLGTTRDRFAYASALSALGRDRDAAREYGRVRRGSLAPRAAYLRARALLRAGRGREARAALRRVAARYRHDASAASSAIFLLGDLAADARDDHGARARFRELARRYPRSHFAPRAELLAALIAFANGDERTAAAELDALVERHPHSDEVNAATYWSARAWAAEGATEKATTRWRRLVERSPRSYYSLLAARRLGIESWSPSSAPDSFPRLAGVDSALDRAAILSRLGLRDEARREYASLAADPDASPERLLATAAALRAHGLAWRGIALATRALSRGAPRDASTYRLLYPLPPGGVLAAAARERDLDPALVAALVRQESRFDPDAVSRAGAVGLMQIMPRVGRQLASALHFPVWDTELLRQPDVNLRLGTSHLAAALHDQAGVARALAAYNAGAARVARWITKRGTDDAEMFVERIPYAETRDYVRIIERDRALYRALYGDAVAAE